MSRSIPLLRRVVFSFILIASVAVASVAYHVGQAHANSQPDVVVNVDLSSPAATSHLAVGVSHIYNGLGLSGLDPAAQASAQTLLSQGVSYENRNIYGWGLRDPNPSPGTYDWSDLDSAVNGLRQLGGTPVLTLCCSPAWMTTLGYSTNGEPDYNAAPTPAHYGDYADLARLIAQRYPDITHFQVWNEVKGFNWSAVAYTTFYNGIYDALKAVNPAIQVGGPYLPVQGGGTAGSGTDGNPIPPWQISFLGYWLANKHGADFLDLDYSVVDYNATPPDLDQIIAGTGRFEAITSQVRALPGYANLPIWWAEDYCDVNQGRLSYMPDNFQGACLASILYHELRSGASVSLRWSPGGDSYATSGQADIESLFTDAQRSGGGHPYPAYYAYQAIHDYFGPGVPIYATTVSSTSVEALASSAKTLLINQGGSQIAVELGTVIYTLAPYQVTVVDTPSQSSAAPLATPLPPTATPLPTNLLHNSSFEMGGGWWADWWPLAVRSGATATFARDPTTAVSGAYSTKISVTQSNAQAYYVQLQQPGLSLGRGHTYTLSFWAKAAAPRGMQACAQQANAPYVVHSCQNYSLGSGWQRYTMTLSVTAADPNAAVAFNLAGTTGPVWLDAVSLT